MTNNNSHILTDGPPATKPADLFYNLDVHIKNRSIILYLLFFLLLTPLALQIDYRQNDEWVYYPNVSSILSGNLNLHPLTSPTFYSTGFLAAAFSLIFGINHLPILTLFISVMSSYLTFLILNERIGVKKLDSFLISLLILCNPLVAFTAWGFMTDNYFLLFLLWSIYYFNDNKIVADKLGGEGRNSLILGNLFAVIAYFTRQLGLLLPLSVCIWLLFNKKYKRALIELLLFCGLATYHFFFFPKSVESLEMKFVFDNIFYFRYVFSLGFVILIYLFLFLLPLSLPNFNMKKAGWKKTVLVIAATLLILALTNRYFKNIDWIGERLYYLKYTLQRDGFFVENVHGDKSGFAFSGQVYSAADLVAKLAGIATLVTLLLRKKYKPIVNLNAIIFLLYTVPLFFIEKVYDRYLIPIFPLFAFIIIDIRRQTSLSYIRRVCVLIFSLILGFYSYNFSLDYIYTNKYIWNKSLEISNSGEVDKNQLVATDSWRYLYPTSNVLYKFTYDNPSKQDYSTNWTLVESYEIKYPLRIMDNTIFLYKKL